MKINTLRLENFQGIKAATFDFKGQSASIYGDNATGKTKLVTPTPFEQTAEYASLAAAVAASKAAEAGAGQTTTTALEALNAQIQAVYAESRELQQQKGKADQAEAQRKRIAELQDQEKALSAQYEELEKGIYLSGHRTAPK